MEEKKEMLTEQELPSLVGAEPIELAKAIAARLDDKKGQGVKVLAVADKTSIADYFVLGTGNSGTHVKALAGEIEDYIGKRGVDADNVEGRGMRSWIVLDYGNVIVHVFDRESREFYNLDKLYGDAKVVLEY